MAVTSRLPAGFVIARSPVKDWPKTLTSSPTPETAANGVLPLSCSPGPVNLTLTDASVPGIANVSSKLLAKLFTRTCALPEIVVSPKPMVCATPWASSANAPLTLWMRPIVAFVSRIPRARGFRSPFASVRGPSPKKIVMPVPAKVSTDPTPAIVRVE